MKLWAGSEESYHLVADARLKVEQLQATPNMKAGWIDDMVAALPPIWRHEGKTAVIEINGPLVHGAAGYLRLFGVLGYDDVAAAVIAAAQHEDTAKMMYHINSPGGDVTGIIDMADLLGQISAMKPSATHTSEQMCSAGYWLASAIKGNFISAGAVAVVGSIGVLKVHMERSKQMEDAGVKATIIRSGKYKAELNPIEPLTPEVLARAQAEIADVHTLFRSQVAKGRPSLAAEDLAEVTEGQVFLGARAVKAGLADKVGSFDLALKLLDNRKQSRDTSSNSKGKAMTLTPEQLKAIAAGAPLASFGLNADGTEMSAAELEAYAAKVRADADAKAAKDADDARAEAERKAAANNQSQAPPEDKGVVALLKEQLASANAKITELTVAATAHTAVAAAHEGLLAIARKATANMLIPMGGTSAAVDGMDASAVIAEHARVQPLFLAKFPVGRVSDTPADDKSKADDLPLGFVSAVKTAPSANRK